MYDWTSKVRPGEIVWILSPVGSSFDGRRGTVERVVDGATVMVRVDLGERGQPVLPFGMRELRIGSVPPTQEA